MKLVLGIFLLVSAGVSQANEQEMLQCESAIALERVGFVEKGHFKSTVEKLLKKTKNTQQFVDEMDQKFFHSLEKRWARLLSKDSLLTATEEMAGDVVFISDLKTDEIMEVRWYENGHRMFAVKSGVCPAKLIPMAENSLY